ncbi:MAG: hypothetical protein C4527_26315 [Candidatus Omnitrophota bacterium]|nr:MAG: hypothetical protein C4527_26315 [Candidatus Omnitrophota bacterium]
MIRIFLLLSIALIVLADHVVSVESNSDHPDFEIDLAGAVVVCPSDLSSEEHKAIEMLVDEAQKRTLIRWDVIHQWPDDSVPAIVIAPADKLTELQSSFSAFFAEIAKPLTKGAEGYRILTTTNARTAPTAFIIGHDSRGILFGCGRLLRELHMRRGAITIPNALDIHSAPAYPIRGHQLGYRPKTNTYDAWTVTMWEQYIRDLAVFGVNAVELIPPRSDDDEDSPHYPLPPMEMMIEMSKLLDAYGLDVWIWFPALDEDYTDARTVESSLKEWGEVLSQLPRVDAIFVPGGDPGNTRPNVLMPFLERQTENLHRYHPHAQMWMSPQGFTQEWMDEFLEIMQHQQPAWLHGIVFGPQNRISLPDLRAAIPKQYPIRRYPDITHNLKCQYPVPDWDVAYALTEERESINPRPIGEANIFRIWMDEANGFITYSEGCNDDVNKIVWSVLGWDPQTDVVSILRQYARYFIGERYEEAFAQGLLALERNWEGPLLTNQQVYTTLQQFQEMEKTAGPGELLNWRFQQGLYRAYYDGYLRRRLIYETELEESAMDLLRKADEMGSLLAMNRTEEILDRAVTHRIATDWRSRVFELAEALYQSARMQLSVPRYKAISVGRGANLDLIDRSVNDRDWLLGRFAEIRKLTNEKERLDGLETIVNWTNPGAGGFYDDLGNLACQPHLIRGPGAIMDPEFRESSQVGFHYNQGYRMSWIRFAESRYDTPLKMEYKNLDSHAGYRIRVVYAGEIYYHGLIRMRLVADDGVEIHPYIQKEDPARPMEFDIPAETTQDGHLTLRWYQDTGRGSAGRGCQVSEVWLIKR